MTEKKKQLSPVGKKRKASTPDAIKRQIRTGAKVTQRAAIAKGDPSDVNSRGKVVRLGKTQTRIITGQEDLSKWTDEELMAGQKRDSRGKVPIRKPTYYTRPIFEELVRRTMSKAHELMRENTVVAVQMLVDVVKGQDVEDKDRLKAIDMILSRVLGKEPIKVEVGPAKSQFDEFMDKVFLVYDENDPDPEDDDNVIDVTSRIMSGD